MCRPIVGRLTLWLAGWLAGWWYARADAHLNDLSAASLVKALHWNSNLLTLDLGRNGIGR